jgi:hypothetical protein
LAGYFAVHRAPSAVRRKAVSRRAAPLYCEAVLSTGGKVNTEKSYEWRKQLMWGLVLIGLGVAFLLDRLDLFDIYNVWHYWPLILVVIGINKMIGYPTAKHFSSGLWMVFVGLWIFATFENMFGLTWGNSWPILIILWGVTLVIEPMIQQRFPSNQEPRDEK